MDRKSHGRSAYTKRGCRCEICVAAQRGYYQANRDRHIAYSRKYYADNREKCLADLRRYRKANPERFKKNTPERRARHRDQQAARRVLINKSGVLVEHRVVFERDNYICQICKIECPRDAEWPAKNFATLDHIIPVSKGGEHTYENTQCLCLTCNISKGAKLEERLAT